MSSIKTIAIVILTLSFVVFVALFGRLPAFRKTPIGFLHRLLLKHIPNTFIRIDEFLTGRRLSNGCLRTGNYLINEKHPLVLIFFVSLQIISEILFIPPAYPHLTRTHNFFLIPVLVFLPLYTLYKCATVNSNITTPVIHHSSMHAYPYDYILFHPGYYCSTCQHAKPPRSKHCSLCKACVQKHDHHCIWINNCVGRANYVWFLALITSTALLLAYGAVMGFSLLDGMIQERLVPERLTRGSLSNKRWTTNMDWSRYFQWWAWIVGVEWRIGAVMLLAFMSWPLAMGFLVYHIYLIWAGMTTNESAKWADWREDIADGIVFKCSMEELKESGELGNLPVAVEPRNEDVRWPIWARSRYWVCRTRDGRRPKKRRGRARKDRNGNGLARGSDETVERGRQDPGQTLDSLGGGIRPGSEDRRELQVQKNEEDEEDERWIRVESLAEIENVYDLGFWSNLVDALTSGG